MTIPANRTPVLFIHGGGDDGYGADAPLAAALQQELGAHHSVHYPRMPDDESLPDFGWVEKIEREIAAIARDLLLAGHSLGASMILKCLSEKPISAPVRGIFLLATPFWSGEEEWEKGLMLRKDFANALPDDVPVFLYHCRDDEELDLSHLSIYEAKLPQATIRTPATGGHQFNDALRIVARDMERVTK